MAILSADPPRRPPSWRVWIASSVLFAIGAPWGVGCGPDLGRPAGSIHIDKKERPKFDPAALKTKPRIKPRAVR